MEFIKSTHSLSINGNQSKSVSHFSNNSVDFSPSHNYTHEPELIKKDFVLPDGLLDMGLFLIDSCA